MDKKFQPIVDNVTRLGNDVGLHAGKEAMATLMRIIGPLPSDAHRAIALGVALGYIRAKLDGLLDMGDSAADRMLRVTYEASHKVFAAAGEEMLAALRAGDFAKAAEIAGVAMPDEEND